MNCEDKFLTMSCIVFSIIMVIILSLLIVGEYLIVSSVSNFAII